MYTNILVATGGSPWSDAAVAYAIAIASRTGAKLHVLTVLLNPSAYTTPDVMGGVEVVADLVEHQGRELLAQAEAKAREARVDVETLYRWGSVPDIILQTAADSACDLMVLGARQLSGWKRLRLGRHVNAVAAKARRPVLVVKAPPAAAPGMPLGRRILVATGGSPWSDMAVEHAIRLARTECFALCLLHVMPGRRPEPGAEETGRAILARASMRAAEAGIEANEMLQSGDISKAIVETAAREACDGIILGSRGSSGWKRLMVGSISNAVAVKTALPVLIVKQRMPVY
ncbi:universal stress protein [Candidatus Entotheonella palauensis]|uniref:UspA domain-containing protein n=1 Tax=Candidatus Entotheonella gemina TaxID=1429439 RepID=W4LIC4_9BACT|nr:universal stress protein [Candidatus Entotheonella palauensis]ETW97732.1 MAG: hypothetical protein ETSY2_44045 [Candidatus Entotheonella gemina]